MSTAAGLTGSAARSRLVEGAVIPAQGTDPRPAPAAPTEANPHAAPDSVTVAKDARSLRKKLQADAARDFVRWLDMRVPTTTPVMSVERRQKILSVIQPGDIMLETDNAYPGWQNLEFTALRSSHTHAAVFEGDGKFLEATTPDGVQRTDLASYLQGNLMITIVRPQYQSPADLNAALDYYRAQLGKPYANDFNLDDPKAEYCAGYVYKGLQAMPNKMDVPVAHVLGHRAVGPDAFLKLAGAQVVYDDGANFWANQASHWPVALGGVAVAALGAAAAGAFGTVASVAGGVCGMVAGLALSICVGNKIQVGHFNFTGE